MPPNKEEMLILIKTVAEEKHNNLFSNFKAKTSRFGLNNSTMKHFDTSDRLSNHYKFFGHNFGQFGSSGQTNETIRHQIYSILTQNLIL